MKTYIYMVRHAVSPFVLGNERERGLSEKGHADAYRIKELLAEEKITHFVSSPYRRAVETIKYLAEASNQEIELYEELRERAIGSVEIEISEDDFLQGIRTSFSDKYYKMPDGESTQEAQERAIPVIKQLIKQHKGGKIALGTHGNIMTIILNYFDKKYGYEFFEQTSKPDIYKLEFEELELTHVERLWDSEVLNR
ncbi:MULTISPECIES: histidine phosphatase family protein [Paenibacillus]|uniref:histidine phosphatase family protein n=1 Tax=Paenibacillus TaxID=44249 RepID=UPI00096DC592|nr:histidine phosphatase family protein [Paenibacillus odorifer]MEC0130789.1 histidine phosphatase family protein [Paenibacillus odorifer]MEC0220994.1 histidine phosphatase family protein [Paenibacillus odorifer]OMC97610.1 histidine phosphatase family protein [Paenibacillus odorifer]OMD04677.1 histidine phosphatase family protein [Paenibacillus odorifer]OMD08915.1 histidine phosphatase family protein [Paenibacillus odorifer]